MTRLSRGKARRCRPWMTLCLMAALLAAPAEAAARNLEPGRLFVGAGLGAAARMGTPLAASPAAGLVTLQGEYTLHRAASVVTDLTLGMASTNVLVGAAGMRGRLPDLGLALSPYGQVQLAAGGLFDVLGANVPWLGSRLGVGVDYFLTGRTTASVGLSALLGGTLSQRSAFYGMVQVLVSLHGATAAAAKPVPNPLPVLGA